MKKILLLFMVSALLGCTGEKTKNLANQIYETEDKRDLNKEKRIKEITRDIKRAEDDLNDALESYKKIGNYHRVLGVKLMHYKMFLKAYDHFSIAIEYYPASEMLLYYRGVAAGQYAISQDREDIKRDYLNRSRISHEQALKLNPRFAKSLYALSILYVYEFDRPFDAKPLLDDLLDVSSRNFDAMLLRALLYERDGKFNAAVDLYDKVLKQSKKQSHQIGAESNRERVLRRIAED